MKSIYEHIIGLEPSEWDYYTRNSDFPLSNTLNWDSETEHQDFIEKYLQTAGKSEIIQEFEYSSIPFNLFKRKIHTNSVFFLGCIFYKHLNLKDCINFKRKDNQDEFFFIWFLTSLVHDFGYYFENCSSQNKDILRSLTNDINTFINKHNLTEHSLLDVKETLLQETNIKILFNNISNYYKYRFNGKKDTLGKIDHGIAAGMLLYNSLVKNRKFRKKNRKKDKGYNLYWGDELDEFYAIASASIATHNMWRCEKDEDVKKEVYIKNGLEQLIIDNDSKSVSKLSISNDPFAFLFALCDTFEPIKQYECFKPSEVLHSISLEFNDNNIYFENIKGSKLNFEKLKANIFSMQSWCELTYECINLNKFKITLQ